MYTECWDLEIFDFIDLRKTSGEERRRARDLFLAIMYNDLFMQREEQDLDWTLFDPKDVPGLTEVWGGDFFDLYTHYEEEYKKDPSKFNPNTRVVKCRDVLRAHIQSWAEIGMPFVAFKDTINNAHRYPHIGPIRSSNLCVTGDTKIFTRRYGNVAIGNLVNMDVEWAECWNGEEWSNTRLFKTSDGQKVVTVKFTNGKHIDASMYHQWDVLQDGNVVTLHTNELQPGMELVPYKLPSDYIKDASSREQINEVPNVIESIEDIGEIATTYCGNEAARHRLVFNGVLTKQCTEVTVYTDITHTGVCNLGSINLARYTTKERLKEIIYLANRIMDNCIDLTEYPLDNAKRFQEKFRAVGLGTMGEAEYLARNHIHYGSEEHIGWIDFIWSYIHDTIRESSKELALEKTDCLANPGYRNAYFTAIAPNSSSAILAGTTNGLEPVYNKIWIEENKRGSYKITAPGIDAENFIYYKNPYEIPMEEQLKVTATRQKYIDMSQSQNVFLDPQNLGIKRVRDIINQAWKLGLKTLYYLRSKPPKLKGKANNEISCVGCAN